MKISTRAIEIVNYMINLMFDRIAREAASE